MTLEPLLGSTALYRAELSRRQGRRVGRVSYERGTPVEVMLGYRQGRVRCEDRVLDGPASGGQGLQGS